LKDSAEALVLRLIK